MTGYKRRYVRKAKATKSTAVKALNKASLALKRIGKPECKISDVIFSSTAVPSGGTIDPLYGFLVQGNSDTTRIGNKVTGKYIEFNYRLIPQNDTNRPCLVRFIIFKDKAPDGALPGIGELLDFTTSASPLAHYNMDNKSRFTVLWDKVIPVGYVGVTAANQNPGGPSIQHGHKKINLKDLEMSYAANAGAATDMSTNHVFLCQVSDTSAADNQALLNFRSRLCYTDD